MRDTKVPSFLNLALAIFYQSLTKGEMPTVKRKNASGEYQDTWPDFLAKMKGQSLDKFFLFRAEDSFTDLYDTDEKHSEQFNAVAFTTMDPNRYEMLTSKHRFDMIFVRVCGEWVLDRVEEETVRRPDRIEKCRHF
jgi:hypothetical protein